MLLEKSINWTKDTDIDVVGTVSDFLSDQFGELITKSMEDFLRMRYGNDESIDRIIEQKIADQLDRDAIPVFHLDNSTGTLNLPQWGFVSVPKQAPSILNGIKNFQKHALSHSNFTIKESELKNRIFWLNTRNGVPLYAYSPLKVYEEAYERTILDKEGVGRHLMQTERMNWTYLPSPIPEKSWGDTYSNERIRAYNNFVRDLFSKAKSLGVIVEKNEEQNTGSRFKCIFTEQLAVVELLKDFEITAGEVEKASLGNMQKCAQRMKGILAGERKNVGESNIFGSINEEMAVENLIRSPRLIERIKSEVDMYSAIETAMLELETFIKEQKMNENLLNQFLEAVYTKTIRKKGVLYVYDKEGDEDPWDPFVNIMRTNDFIDFELYKAFKELEQKQMTMLLRKAERRGAELVNKEDTGELVLTLQELAASYQQDKEKLDYDRNDYANGEELYEFYKEILLKVNGILKKLK